MDSSQQSQDLTQEDRLSLVNDTVLYIISHDSLNLIKRQDIIKNILKEKKKHFSEIIKLVKERLVQDFGLDLVDVEENKVYAVVYRVTDKFNVYPVEVEADRILLILVLTLIFMNNGVMAEDDIMKTLKRLKIKSDVHDKKHETFGDVENAIKKKFVRWLFLECNTISGTDPPQYEFRWGSRAEIQISKKRILDFACEILETSPDSWELQCEEVEKQKIVT
ncbi:hypothetical protein J437_LFUL010884 [Ladona fulva]|uniref:MAGE domain-containing protein n=1 Tax=Ladona fulva TaxID=123851 RepID=A0A8K0KDP4_LADFU|nr:hypothetical protein J437_LFUL010884 [Ladona fulva]